MLGSHEHSLLSLLITGAGVGAGVGTGTVSLGDLGDYVPVLRTRYFVRRILLVLRVHGPGTPGPGSVGKRNSSCVAVLLAISVQANG
jgi:hypothetical protein